MNARKRRLERVVSLRGQLHERSVQALQMARAEVAAAVREVANGQQQMSACREDQLAAIVDGEHEQWLMARSGSALSSMVSAHRLQNQRTREQMASVAAQNEVQLRCELRQMEQVMARAVHEELLLMNRKEQQQMEEIARLMGSSRDKLHLSLETT